MSAYEGEHMIFGLLGQANLAQNDVLQDFFNKTLTAQETKAKISKRDSIKLKHFCTAMETINKVKI
jgi:hypothetical protein